MKGQIEEYERKRSIKWVGRSKRRERVGKKGKNPEYEEIKREMEKRQYKEKEAVRKVRI